MKIAIITGRTSIRNEAEFLKMCSDLSDKGADLYQVEAGDSLRPDTDFLLSVGGDGTFLSAAAIASPAGIPVLGVNMGRLGFLSENTPGSAVRAITEGTFSIENRILLETASGGATHLSLNEMCVHRCDGGMLGVNVTLGSRTLPTYWADGLLVCTPSGSTAYSLSCGGPIVLPSSDVLLITPVASHNLNVRPLVIPSDSVISLSFESRSDRVCLSTDNVSWDVPSDSTICVRKSPFFLKKVCLENTSFINALSEKLFWGKDKRTSK